MYIFIQPAHTRVCTKEVRIINGQSPWVSPGATKEGLQKRPQEPGEAGADTGFLWFFVAIHPEKGRVGLRKRRLFEWMVVEIIEP